MLNFRPPRVCHASPRIAQQRRNAVSVSGAMAEWVECHERDGRRSLVRRVRVCVRVRQSDSDKFEGMGLVNKLPEWNEGEWVHHVCDQVCRLSTHTLMYSLTRSFAVWLIVHGHHDPLYPQTCRAWCCASTRAACWRPRPRTSCCA
jgi:hypothetical protein